MSHKVDELVSNHDKYKVLEDYSCTLNQVTLGCNNNKFYVIQALQDVEGKYFLWTHWGRVGESGQNALSPTTNRDGTVKAFCKKFRDKTGNEYGEPFTAKAGKYVMLTDIDNTVPAAPVARVQLPIAKRPRSTVVDNEVPNHTNYINNNEQPVVPTAPVARVGLPTAKRPFSSLEGEIPNYTNYIIEGYSCTLNQVTLGCNNNNKFYVIQALQDVGGKYFLWTHWGRVGEPGYTALTPTTNRDDAVKAFCKKFRDKTGNEYGEPFTAKAGKYVMLTDIDNTVPAAPVARVQLPIAKRPRSTVVDNEVPNHTNYMILEGFSCTLNQVTLGCNNNKFYVIQALQNVEGEYFLWKRWGRVGESGSNMLTPTTTRDDAVKAFCKKYCDKTGNEYGEPFTTKSGKYDDADMHIDNPS